MPSMTETGKRPATHFQKGLSNVGSAINKIRLAVIILLAAVYLQPTTSAQDQSANIEAGRQIFIGSCSVGYCHGLGGVGGGGPKLAGRKFSVRYLTQVINEGVQETTMPGFKNNLSQEQLGNLILYVQSLAISTATESNQPAVQEHLSEDRELMGNAAAGRTMFFDSSSAPSCIVCHSIDGRGGKIAPDLSEIAAKPAKEILQSISEPNANIDDKYATLTLTLKNGARFTGVKHDENATSLRLYDTSSLPPISRSFLKSEIAKTETLKTSAMPGDYATKYSRQQLLDLVGFLKSGGENR